MQLNSRNDAAYWAKVPGLSGTFLQVTSVLATRENDWAIFCRIFCSLLGSLTSGVGQYSKQCVVVEGGGWWLMQTCQMNKNAISIKTFLIQ